LNGRQKLFNITLFTTGHKLRQRSHVTKFLFWNKPAGLMLARPVTGEISIHRRTHDKPYASTTSWTQGNVWIL